MKLFLVTFAVLAICIFGMAIGYILAGKKLKGSCGGLNNLMGEDCMFCDKKEECDKKKKEQAALLESEVVI